MPIFEQMICLLISPIPFSCWCCCYLQLFDTVDWESRRASSM